MQMDPKRRGKKIIDTERKAFSRVRPGPESFLEMPFHHSSQTPPASRPQWKYAKKQPVFPHTGSICARTRTKKSGETRNVEVVYVEKVRYQVSCKNRRGTFKTQVEEKAFRKMQILCAVYAQKLWRSQEQLFFGNKNCSLITHPSYRRTSLQMQE